jgi:hypothetical protein
MAKAYRVLRQALFASPGTTRRTRPAGAARIRHRLITELTTLATATSRSLGTYRH